ncbi:hypothetical protein OJAV_G00114290 [Oryzias javanicus]|uniref:CRAL-TRIO domain-containing protein n=1 Tax=Oryzias javanicus TaxID=123683 RepID=A0A3S2Q1F2_ORYJA|nr:hypothetical protein OJAV_G00114290 [Oryzias javanicus]
MATRWGPVAATRHTSRRLKVQWGRARDEEQRDSRRAERAELLKNNMESIKVEEEEKTFRSLVDESFEGINGPEGLMDPARTSVTGSLGDPTEDEETGEGHSNTDAESEAKSRTEDERREETSDEDEEAKEEVEEEDQDQQECDLQPGDEKSKESEDKISTQSRERPAPPSSLALSGPKSIKKKVLAAPALSLSLGGSFASEDFAPGFISPSPEDDDDTKLDLDLDAMDTPSDSESLHFPNYDLDLEDDLRRLGVASHKPFGSGSLPDQSGLSALEKEDVVDSKGTRWRCFSTGDPPQESRVNMTVLEPFLRVLSHGGYYGDGMDDIVVFSSCYLPENGLENYQYVMDNLFRFVVGTLELMVAENYVIVYLCSGGQKDKLPGIGWLRDWYTTIDRSSKFSRKLQFVESLQDLSQLIPTEHVQIPDGVRQYDQSLSR